MHPPRSGVGQLCQLVGVGAFELAERPVLKQLGRQRVVFSQFFQYFLVGTAGATGSFFYDLHAQLVKKYFCKLLGAAQVKGLAGNFISLGFQLQQALAKFMALRCQHGPVN